MLLLALDRAVFAVEVGEKSAGWFMIFAAARGWCSAIRGVTRSECVAPI